MKFSFRVWSEGRLRGEEPHTINLEASDSSGALDLLNRHMQKAWCWTTADLNDMRYKILNVEDKDARSNQGTARQ